MRSLARDVDILGASAAMPTAYGVSDWVGKGDVDGAEDGRVDDRMAPPLRPVARFSSHFTPDMSVTALLGTDA